jgi:hypothetical protein
MGRRWVARQHKGCSRSPLREEFARLNELTGSLTLTSGV